LLLLLLLNFAHGNSSGGDGDLGDAPLFCLVCTVSLVSL